MTPVNWLSRLFFPKKPEFAEHAILPIEEQIRAWRNSSKKMNWDIGEKKFNGLDTPPSLTDCDLEQGFVEIAFFYGFGAIARCSKGTDRPQQLIRPMSTF
jgi:hypothetical protein